MITRPRRTPSVRGARGLAALCLLVLGLLLVPAAPVQAHAVLIGTDPAEGSVLAEAPERVTFSFNETVGAVPDGVRVFDAQGDPIDSSVSATGSKLEIALDEPVEDGTVVVVWRIVSDDGHPVSGTLRFSVGAPSATVAEIDAPSTDAERPPVLLQALRIVGYVGLLLTGGLVAFVLLVLPAESPDRARRRLVLIARAAAVAAALVWAVLVPAVALYQLGGGLDLLGRGSTWGAVAPAEYVVAVMVAVGTLSAVALLGTGVPTGPRRVLAVVAAAIAVVAPALTGHSRATSPEWLVIAVDALHLLTGSVWLGGVVALSVTLHLLAARGTLALEALARFSAVAAVLLVVMTASGIVLAWRILGSWSALVETTYGLLLIAKVATVAVVVALAAWNRFVLLPRAERPGNRKERRSNLVPVSRVVIVEASLLVVVLVLTGLLVDRSPDVTAAPVPAAVRTTQLGKIEAKATVASPVTGPSSITLELLDTAGQPTEGYAAPQAALASGDLDLGAVTLQNVGPGLYTGQVIFPSAGEWKLQVSLRTGEFDNPVDSVSFTVGESPS